MNDLLPILSGLIVISALAVVSSSSNDKNENEKSKKPDIGIYHPPSGKYSTNASSSIGHENNGNKSLNNMRRGGGRK